MILEFDLNHIKIIYYTTLWTILKNILNTLKIKTLSVLSTSVISIPTGQWDTVEILS